MKTATLTQVATPLPGVVDLIAEAREAITRIAQRDAQIAPLAKMNREDWLKIGMALSDLRKKHKSDKEYGAAVREAGLDQGCCADRFARRDAIWFYENSTGVYTPLESTNICHPNAIRRYIRGLESEKSEPAEPTVDIKFATTEHPIALAPQPPQRPPCPGVEGDLPGQYKWSDNSQTWLLIVEVVPEWMKDLGKKAQGQLVNKPTVSARDWLVDYLKFAKEDVIIEVLKTIRRCEHPDRGGNHNATVICNQYLEYMK